jgi:hypothetical protein
MKIFFHYILPSFLILALGIAIGVFIRDFPKFTIKYDVKIIDIFKLVATVGIGVFIPLVVKKLIDDKRSKNDNLLEEISGVNKMIDSIHNYIQNLHQNKKIIAKDKDYLNMQLDLSGNEIVELCSFLSKNCSKRTTNLVEDLKSSYMDYWHVSTSIEVIGSSVRKIDDSTFKKVSKSYSIMKKRIRDVKAEILKK